MPEDFTNRHNTVDDYPTDQALDTTTSRALQSLAYLNKFNNEDAVILENLAAQVYKQADHHLQSLDPYINEQDVIALTSVQERTAEIFQHYRENGIECREHEREQWSQILQHASEHLQEYDHTDVRQIAEKLSHSQDPTRMLKEIWKPENTVIIGPTDYTIETVTTDVPFLKDYPSIIDDPTTSDVRGKHVIGSIPEDLELHAESITRYSIRLTSKEPAEWSWKEYQNPIPQERELITYRAKLHAFSVHHLDQQEMTFVTNNPLQAIHWKRNGMFDPTESIFLVTEDEQVAQKWDAAGFLDHRTNVMTIEHGIEPERWMKDIPKQAAIIYSALPEQAELILVQNRHVAGTVPVHIKHTARSVTTWPHDQNTETFGRPVTVRTKLISRMRLPNTQHQ